MNKKNIHGLLMITLLFLSKEAFSQDRSTYYYKDRTVDWILQDLEKKNKQLHFDYSTDELKETSLVNIKLRNATLDEFLDTLCSLQNLKKSIQEGIIYIRRKVDAAKLQPKPGNEPNVIRGRVTDNQNKPIGGANISTKDHMVLAVTDSDGRFIVITDKPITTLRVSHVSYQTAILDVSNPLHVTLNPSSSSEPSINVNHIRYVRNTGTGSVVTLNGAALGKQPSHDLAETLIGRVAGLNIRPTSGAYGAYKKMQIRNSFWLGLGNGISMVTDNSPLILLDNMPLPSLILNQIQYIGGNPNAVGTTASGLSILRVINIDDIESVVILKDGDATSMYGTKGANGVIIINTKRAKQNEPHISFHINAGIVRSSLRIQLLNTHQYLKARTEAFNNDATTITADNAPDLNAFDQNRYVDWKKYFLGNTANVMRGNLSVSKASDNWGYRMGVAFRREGSILPGKLVDKDLYDQDASASGSVYVKSKDKKLLLSVNGMYFMGKTYSTTQDIGQAIKLTPNAPEPFDSSGNLAWNKWIANPVSYLLYEYRVSIENAFGHYNVTYVIDSNFAIKSNGGFNMFNIDEVATIPIKAQDPSTFPEGSAEFASAFFKNTQFELMGEHKMRRHQFSIETLAGFTDIKQKINKDKISASGISSDVLLLNQQAAASIKGVNSTIKYAYVGIWGNTKLVHKERYLLNLTLRRDGSSRFSPGKRFGWFWGIGAGWVFSKDSLIHLPKIITFGKLRASYGTTGNDEIGNYPFNGSWSRIPAQRPYDGIVTLSPTGHNNEDISWGLCRKFEISGEFTFKKLMNFTATYYYNSNTSQIINESLPNYTGFGNIIKNNPVKTVSKGFELTIQKRRKDTSAFSWECSVNVTIPQTELTYFPAFETSNYTATLSIGDPVNSQKGLVFLGVDSATGVYKFLDADQSGTLTRNDYRTGGTLDPVLYGGINNTFSFKRFTLDMLWEFYIQKGINQFLDYAPMRFTSNGYTNIPVQLLQRWQKPGDAAPYQVYSANPASAVFSRLVNMRSSNALLVNANYWRLRNISLSYTGKSWKIGSKHEVMPEFYVAGENVILISKYQGADPASQQPGGIPILRRYSIGVKLNIN